jgi:hypothetical protein
MAHSILFQTLFMPASGERPAQTLRTFLPNRLRKEEIYSKIVLRLRRRN